MYKAQVRKIGEYLGVPESILIKKSSPHLWLNHLAEDEIGMTYEEIDSILFCLFEKKLSVEETAKTTQIEKHLVDKIYTLNKNSQHKRITAARPFQ